MFYILYCLVEELIDILFFLDVRKVFLKLEVNLSRSKSCNHHGKTSNETVSCSETSCKFVFFCDVIRFRKACGWSHIPGQHTSPSL